jgi:hypothetical protein
MGHGRQAATACLLACLAWLLSSACALSEGGQAPACRVPHRPQAKKKAATPVPHPPGRHAGVLLLDAAAHLLVQGVLR